MYVKLVSLSDKGNPHIYYRSHIYYKIINTYRLRLNVYATNKYEYHRLHPKSRQGIVTLYKFEYDRFSFKAPASITSHSRSNLRLCMIN